MYLRMLILLLLIFNYSCNNEYSEKNATNNKNEKDSLIQLGPDWLSRAYFFFSEKINLNNIQNGIDSFEMRIWESSSPFMPRSVLRLSYTKNIWEFQKINLAVSPINDSAFTTAAIDSSIYFIKVDSIMSCRLIANCSIERIKEIIDSAEIDILPIQRQNNSKDVIHSIVHGDTYIIEFSKRNYYKLISYKNPEFYSKSEVSNKKVWTFIRSIENCYFADTTSYKVTVFKN